MLPLQNLLVIIALSGTGVGLICIVIMISIRGGNLLGKPSTNPLLFYTGKLSIFFSIGFFLCKAIVPSFGGIHVPEWQAWLGVGMVLPASILLVVSFFQLGTSLSYGLSDQQTRLVTTGLFKYSRNPLYVALFMINIASAIYFPALVNILVTIYCIGSHIIITLGEEKFLLNRFKAEWITYKNEVRRFL